MIVSNNEEIITTENLITLNSLILFTYPLLIVISEFSLLYISLLYIVLYSIILLINNKYLQNNYILDNNNRTVIPITKGIPIAKVIWSEYWEQESYKFIFRYNNISNTRRLNLFNIQMIFLINSWDELFVKSLNNSYNALYNYNTLEPVIGIQID
tara:strand:+ start:2839 stop:3303 length:465 start_codon:yes stop_codon:yes gene_type:complete